MCFNSGIECNQRNHHYGSVLLETTNGDAFGGTGGREGDAAKSSRAESR